MFTVCVRDHVMIAHSLSGDVFGPAQRLHGATYVIDVEFRRRELDADGIVVDIGAAGAALRAILDRINYRNLDDESAFAGTNTTTERLARYVFDRMREKSRPAGLGAVARRSSRSAWCCTSRTSRGRRTKGSCAARASAVTPAPVFRASRPPETPTGGFVYDRHMMRAVRAQGRLGGCLVLPGDYPEPSQQARDGARGCCANCRMAPD